MLETLVCRRLRSSTVEITYTERDTLQAVWGTLSNEGRLEIAHQPREIIKTLYAIPPLANSIASYNSDRLFDSHSMGTSARPACRTQEELHALRTEDSMIPEPIWQAFRKRIGNNHRMIFAQCDIAAVEKHSEGQPHCGPHRLGGCRLVPARQVYAIRSGGGGWSGWTDLIDGIFPRAPLTSCFYTAA